MIDCKDILDKMSLYIDNCLENKELEKFINHINNCEGCKKELEELQSIVKKIENLEKFEVPENFHKELMTKIKNVNKKKYKIYKLDIAAIFILFFLFLNNFLILFISDKISYKDYKKHDITNIDLTRGNFSCNTIIEDITLNEKNKYTLSTLRLKTHDIDKTKDILSNILNCKEIKIENEKDRFLQLHKYITIQEYNNVVKNLNKLGKTTFIKEIYKENNKEKLYYDIEIYNKKKDKIISMINDNSISEEDKTILVSYVENISKIIEDKIDMLKEENCKVYLNIEIDEYDINKKFYVDLKKQFANSFYNRSNFIMKVFLPFNTYIFIILILLILYRLYISFFKKRRIKFDK